MCGRFSLGKDLKTISERFDVPPVPFEWFPRYNIAPTQDSLVVVEEDNHHALKRMKWGLATKWRGSMPVINCRAETASAKPLFRESFQKRRCLIPADGFYEWKKGGATKIPYRVVIKPEGIFAFAGLWDICRDDKGTDIACFTILTTVSNGCVAKLHDRMPVILRKQDELAWLDSTLHDTQKLEHLLLPYPEKEMTAYEVLPIVNSWKNETPDCFLPANK